MRRLTRLLLFGALIAALILPISTVAAATGYNVAGVEYAATQVQGSFAGAAVSADRTEMGVWNAVVKHAGATINGGTFTFKSKIRSFLGSIESGTFGSPAGNCARMTFAVHIDFASDLGFFDGILTHYGYMRGTQCVTYFATVRGTASF
jgi:hypothetical protein